MQILWPDQALDDVSFELRQIQDSRERLLNAKVDTT
jgi:hypothetical protein